MHENDSARIDRRSLLKGGALASAAVVLSAAEVWSPRLVQAGDDMIAGMPGYYPFNVGEFHGLVLSDGAVSLAPIAGGVVTNASAEEINPQLEANFLPTDKVDAALNTFLVRANGKTILVDAGYGDEGAGTNGKQVAQLKAAGLDPADVDVVVITHCHPDHLWGLIGADSKAAYPNAEIVLHENEYNFWGNKDNYLEPAKLLFEGFEKNLRPLTENVRTVKDGEDIVTGVSVVGAAGHTPGHIAVHIQSNGERLLLTADTANHPILFLSHPEYNFSFDFDKPKAVEARKKIFSMAADEKVRVLGYHFPFPGIGNIVREGSGFKYIATPWRS